MAKKSVIVSGGSNVTFGLLKDLYEQLEIGEKTEGGKGLTGAQLRAFLEHRNPFDAEQISAVLPYADEVVESDFGYPEGFRFRTVTEQVKRLVKEFPDLDASHVEALSSTELPKGAEGWGVIPKPSKIAGSYHEAFAKAVDLLKKLHGDKFKNWREGALTEKHLRLVEKTAKMHKRLTETQPGDFWVFDAQFGKRWAGASVRHGRVRYLEEEFGLGPYEVAMLLLTHPDRITGPNQLYIDCGGLEYRTDVSARAFPFCLYFDWVSSYKQLGLSYRNTDNAYVQWGCASGFATQ